MTTRDFRQTEWDADLEDDCRQLIRLAVREDLDRSYDWTTVALAPEAAQGRATVVARAAGVVAGLPAARFIAAEYDRRLEFVAQAADGQSVSPGQPLAELSGSARSLLAAERPLLNMLGRLSGIATLTQAYVREVAGTGARIYDTRKTTPGWRRLEKYAVRMGGGFNHRLGLYDAVLIKDNHLMLAASGAGGRLSPADAVRRVRSFLGAQGKQETDGGMLVEVEVDTLAQLADVLPAAPDIVLLDNMPADQLLAAVEMRNAGFAGISLEASGGVRLDTVAALARCGVERISVGALTHSATCLDVALDWRSEQLADRS